MLRFLAALLFAIMSALPGARAQDAPPGCEGEPLGLVAGAERAAKLWGNGSQTSASYLQDHKAQRTANAQRQPGAKRRPVSLPELAGEHKEAEWSARWRSHSSTQGKQWSAPGAAKPRRAHAGPAPRQPRLVQLAGLKRRELAALCRARGLPTALEDGDGVPRRLETGQLLALLR